MTFYEFVKFQGHLGAYTPYNENFVHTWALKEPEVRSQEPEGNLKG
jgi:hypothetical protein